MKIKKNLILIILVMTFAMPFCLSLEVGTEGEIGLDLNVGLPEFNNNTAFVNASELWITAEGIKDDVSDILASEITDDGTYVKIVGDTMTGQLNSPHFNSTNVSTFRLFSANGDNTIRLDENSDVPLIMTSPTAITLRLAFGGDKTTTVNLGDSSAIISTSTSVGVINTLTMNTTATTVSDDLFAQETFTLLGDAEFNNNIFVSDDGGNGYVGLGDTGSALVRLIIKRNVNNIALLHTSLVNTNSGGNSRTMLAFTSDGAVGNLYTSSAGFNFFGLSNLQDRLVLFGGAGSTATIISSNTGPIEFYASGVTASDKEMVLDTNTLTYEAGATDPTWDFATAGLLKLENVDFEISDGSIAIFSDSSKVFWGAGDDASCGYDGSNLICDPRVVGSGNFTVLGSINSTENYINKENIGITGNFSNDGWFAFSGGIMYETNATAL